LLTVVIISCCAALESAGEEVCEELLRAFLATTTASSCPSHYITFICPLITTDRGEEALTRPITCRVAPRENEVGLRLWEAAFLLSEYLLSDPDLVRSAEVYELGAGLGLVGLIAAFCGSPSGVCLTDGDAEVLRFLRHNVEVNEALGMGSPAKAELRVESLDWARPADFRVMRPGPKVRQNRSYGSIHTIIIIIIIIIITTTTVSAALVTLKLTFGPQVVLGADLVYEEESIPDLVRVLVFALRGEWPMIMMMMMMVVMMMMMMMVVVVIMMMMMMMMM
jgi:predicted nicotinamide N-methyase